jgi:UDP-glucose 4-epimerase
MPERTLVTGAGGFLGSHICNYFGQQGHCIAAIDRLSVSHESEKLYPNLQHFYTTALPDKSLSNIIEEFQPTLLIHCAGSASVPYSMQEPYSDFQQSAAVTSFILDTLRNHMPSCHFVFLSSAAVYGNPEKLPVSEDSPCHPISPYGYHKYICEMLCQEFNSIYGITSSMLRIFSAYGERLHKQVIFDLCKKFFDPSAKTVELFGTGNETRDFIHAMDIAQAIGHIHSAETPGVFNVASGAQTRIGEVVELVKNYFRSDKAIVYTGATRPGDPLFWQADIGKLTSTGFHQRITFHEGIRNYCKWFLSVYES